MLLRIAASTLAAPIADVWRSLQPRAFVGYELLALRAACLLAAPAVLPYAYAAARAMHGAFILLPGAFPSLACRCACLGLPVPLDLPCYGAPVLPDCPADLAEVLVPIQSLIYPQPIFLGQLSVHVFLLLPC